MSTKMAACDFAVATSSPVGVYLYKYSHTELINTGLRYNTAVTRAFQAAHNIPEDIARPGAPWIVVGS